MEPNPSNQPTNGRAIPVSTQYARIHEMPCQALNAKNLDRPVYARLPSPVGYAANGWPIYADGDLQKAASLLISYPHQIPSPSPPANPDDEKTAITATTMEYAYMYPAHIETQQTVSRTASVEPRDIAPIRSPQQASSAPPPSPDRRLPAPSKQPTVCVSTQRDTNDIDLNHADATNDAHSTSDFKANPSASRERQQSVQQKRAPDYISAAVQRHQTPMPSPNDSTPRNEKRHNGSIFPSPSVSPIGSPPTSRSYKAVASQKQPLYQTVPSRRKPPLHESNNRTAIQPATPTKPPLTRPRYKYHSTAPRIQATAIHPEMKRASQSEQTHSDSHNNTDTEKRSPPRTDRTPSSSAAKRRQRKRKMIEEDRKLWDAAHRLPVYSNTWSSSTNDDDEDELQTASKTKKCAKRKKRRSNNKNSVPPKGQKSTHTPIETRIKQTRKNMRQSLIDEYLKTAVPCKYKQCLLCLKKRYLPSHCVQCPACSTPLYTASDTDSSSEESSSSQELPVPPSTGTRRTAKPTDNNEAPKQHVHVDASKNTSKHVQASHANTIPLHADIRASLRLQRKFGVKFTSPSSVPTDSISHCSLQTDSAPNSRHTTARNDTLTLSDYDRIAADLDREVDKLNALYPELLESPPVANNNNTRLRPAVESDHSDSNVSTLARTLSWIPLERKHIKSLRVSDPKTRSYPSENVLIELLYHAYNKQYSRESLSHLPAPSKRSVFDIIRYHLKDVERYNADSSVHTEAPSDDAWLSCLDRYKFKATVHSPSRVKERTERTLSEIDEDTASESDVPPHTESKQNDIIQTPPRRVPTSLASTQTIIRPTLPAISPVLDNNNNLVQFSLPPPIPVVPEPAAQSSNADLLNDWYYENQIRKESIFGTNSINKTDLNTFLMAILFAMCPGDISVKVFYKHRETDRSKSIHCVFNHEPRCRGKCRLCQQKKTHTGCRVGECREFWTDYIKDPDDEDYYNALSCGQGNNGMLLQHFKRVHPSISRELRRRSIIYCRTNPRYVYSVIVPVHKYAALQRERSRLRENDQIEGRILAENKSMLQVLDTAGQGRSVPENEAAQIHKTIVAAWSASESIRLIPGHEQEFQSLCPRGEAKKDWCTLKHDGTVGKRQPVYLPRKVIFVHVSKMKCIRHKYHKLNCTVKELCVVSPDHFNMALFRNGNGLMTPQFLLTLMQKYRTVGHRVSKLREHLIDEYAQTFYEAGHQHMDLPLLTKVMGSFVPTSVTLNKYLRSAQHLVYRRCLHNQISAYLRTSAHAFGFDQTYQRTSRMKGSGSTTTDVGLATSVSAQGILVKLGLLNNKSECFDQWARFLGELKADCLRYGSLEYLKHAHFYWGSDNYKNTKNLPPLINQFIVDQLETNPNYKYIREKLENHQCTVHDFTDHIVECGMHKFMRDYRAMKEIGIHSGSHSDFALYTQEHIDMMNSLQAGIDRIDDIIESDWVNIRDLPADAKFIRAIAWYNSWREKLEIDRMDQQIFIVLTRVLKLDGIHDFTEKNNEINALKQSVEYLSSLQAIMDIIQKVHPSQRRWIVGRWINGENRIDTEWSKKIQIFLDGNGNKVTVYTAATTQQIMDIINRFFMVDPLQYTRHLILYPTQQWIELQYLQLRDSIKYKRCERDDRGTKALWDYPEVQKQWSLACKNESIECMVTTRNADFNSAWLNVLNEQTHKRLAEMFNTIRNCQSPECLMSDLNVQQYHLNDAKFDKILKRDPMAFDALFKHELKEIRQEMAMPQLFSRVLDEKLILDISGLYQQMVKEANEALDTRSIHIKHSRVMRRAERQVLGADIILLQPTEITADLIIHLHTKHKKSIIAIIKELTKYGIPAAQCTSTGLPITANPGQIYERLKHREFDPVHFLPAIDQEESTNDNTNSLPPVPAQYTSNQEQSPAVVAAMIDLHTKLVQVVRFLNDRIPSLQADIQKVHALDLETTTLTEYGYGLLDPRKRAKLWSSVFNTQQQQSIARWTSDSLNISSLFERMDIQYTKQSLYDSSYALCHATQPLPKMTAMTLKYGGDSQTNYKYDKKRSSSQAGFDEGGQGKKRRTVKWKQLYKFDKKATDYKQAMLPQCACNLDEFEKNQSKDTKYGPWLSLNDAIREMKQLSLYHVNEGGLQRLRRYAKAHGFEGTEKHGSSIAFIRDWMIAHIRLNIDIREMDTAKIEELFVTEKLIKKARKTTRK